jgi:hypothetical protein
LPDASSHAASVIRQQTSVINAIRAHLAEFGIVAPVGRKSVEQLLDVVANSEDKRIPEVARVCVAALGAQLWQCRRLPGSSRPGLECPLCTVLTLGTQLIQCRS